MTTPPDNADPARDDTPGMDAPAAAVALREALVEMSHAQGQDVTAARDGETVTLCRRSPYLRITPCPGESCLRLAFWFPQGPPPQSSDLSAPDSPGGPYALTLDDVALDAELLALEPLIAAAYAQNG